MRSAIGPLVCRIAQGCVVVGLVAAVLPSTIATRGSEKPQICAFSLDAAVHVECTSIDFGTVVRSATKSRQIVLHNPTDSPISVVRIVTGCGCITAHIEQPVIPAGGSAVVEFVAEKPRRLGVLPSTECLIECSDGTQIRVPIAGFVRPAFEALLVDHEDIRGIVLVSNTGEAFEHADRSFSAPTADQNVPFAIFAGLDEGAYASLAEAGVVPIVAESVQAVRVREPQSGAIEIDPQADGSCVIRVSSDQFSKNPPLLLARRGSAWRVLRSETNQLVSESQR